MSFDPNFPICQTCSIPYKDTVNQSQSCWYPVITQIWQRLYIKRFRSLKCKPVGMARNFSYSMQYVEFISSKCFKELALSGVLKVMNQKTYVVTSMSLIELLVFSLLKADGAVTDEDLGKKLKNLKNRIDYVATKKFANLGTDWKRKAHELRELRNRVHLYLIEEDVPSKAIYDHDFNNIRSSDVALASKALNETLHKVFASEFSSDEEIWQNRLAFLL